MDRDSIKSSIIDLRYEEWKCPACRHGRLVAKELVKEWELDSSEKYREMGEGTPEDYRGSFSGMLECNSSTCAEKVIVSGRVSCFDVYQEDESGGHHELFYNYHPAYFQPPVRLINVPVGTPYPVVEAVELASALLWADPPSCAGKVRIAIEHVLDHFEIQKTTVNKKNVIEPLKLDSRVKMFEQTHPEEAHLLMACKWIGNAGVHAESPLTFNDALDGLEILERVLTLLFDKKHENLKKLAAEIVAKKAPRRR